MRNDLFCSDSEEETFREKETQQDITGGFKRAVMGPGLLLYVVNGLFSSQEELIV